MHRTKPVAAFLSAYLLLPSTAAIGADPQKATEAIGGKFVLYVAPGGDDTAGGRLPESDGQGGGPLATVEGARDRIRQWKADQKLRAPVTVLLRGGTYRLARPLVFQPQDSGTREAPIAYAAYPGEKPVLSGGRRITGWQPGENQVWTVNLPEVKSGGWHFRQLFVDGHRRPRARTPNEGWFHLAGLPRPDDPKDPINRKAFRFEPGDVQGDWTNLDDVEIVKFFGWSETRLPIERVDQAEPVCYCAGLCSDSYKRLFDWFGPRYYVENVFEGLDAPGEWYLNRKTGVLYYWPMPGEDMHKAEAVAPQLDCLVQLEGKPERDEAVEYLTFRGLGFLHAGAAFPEKGYPEQQSDVFVPGVIRATGARHCRWEENEIAQVGSYAIDLGDGCQHNAIVGNDLHDLGAGGIKMSGPRRPPTDAFQTGHMEVTDNRIHDGGHIYFGGTGIWAGFSGYNNISHNEVCDLYGMGISIGWTWSFVLTPARDNLVEYNHVHHLGHKKVGACSGLYTLARQPGTKLRNNLVHDIQRYTDGTTHPAFGIQVDNGSGEILFENNVVYNVPDACWKQFGRLHTVRNNIFAFAAGYEILRRRDEGELVFERNIVLSDDGKFFGDRWKRQNYQCDHNLYWDTSDEPQDFGGMSFEAWQAQGHDKHSRMADPGFADPKSGNFRLPADSPAQKIGFQPIDLSTVGPRDRGQITRRAND